MGSFSIKKGEIEKITSAMIFKESTILDGVKRKMDLIVDIVWKTARARRPKISATEQKALGRPTGKGVYRVSDPNAKLGVPVDTGALQASIEKNVKVEGKKIIGTIEAGRGLIYAPMIEFGTSKMRPRPFMRPAWNENLDWIRKKWKEKLERL